VNDLCSDRDGIPGALREAFTRIEHDHPGWHCWRGTLPHLLYARRPLTSPPWVVRAPDPAALREAIEAYERGER
jgi:hypothetical protein